MCCPHKFLISYTCNSVVRKPDAYFMFMQHVFDIFHSHISSDDDNRIVLKPLSDCQNDYINASYVDVRILSLNNYWTLKITLIVYVHQSCLFALWLSYRVMKVFINLALAKVNIIITSVSRKGYTIYMLRFGKFKTFKST